jgi:hypothetical protein
MSLMLGEQRANAVCPVHSASAIVAASAAAQKARNTTSRSAPNLSWATNGTTVTAKLKSRPWNVW